jgi:D-beta-D-heptose 7-phosphate kinase/D-beta-D-heptose 1-phosphate adenosyltransferase
MKPLEILEKLSRVKILVIGDLMLDHYIWGDVHRISPEAPVPVVHASRDSWAAGGAANVALNLANLGARTTVIGHLADDDAGHRLHQMLLDHGVTAPRKPVVSQAPTIIKTRVMARGQQLCRIDRESSADTYRLSQDRDFSGILAEALDNADAVILSDYAKGTIHQEIVDQVLGERARTRRLVAVDPKPSRCLNIRYCGLLTPNRNEALELAGITGIHPNEEYPLDLVCRRIHEEYAPELLVITLGAEGMAVCQNGCVQERIPTHAREVFDVSGAGDTVIAALTVGLAAGASPVDAARIANLAAGCVVAHMGTVPVQLDEVLREIEKDSKRVRDTDPA